jgi:signal transduction histidine kinase
MVRRFTRAVTFQLLLVGLAAILGIWGAGAIMKEMLVRQALLTEAEYFWELRSANPDVPLPDTRNLTGYLSESPDLPPDLRALSPGFHELDTPDHFSVALVSEHQGERLTLVFEGAQVRSLALWFGLVPLAIVLVVVYVSLYLGYRLYRTSVSPVVRLAHEVETLQLESSKNPDFDVSDLPQGTDREIQVLSDALRHLIERVNDFISREREFTRDASHELRSPLTVVRVACDLVLKEPQLDDRVRKSILKIQRASLQMTNLIEAFLLLAREPERHIESGVVCVNDLLMEEIDRAKILVEGRSVELITDFEDRIYVRAPERVVSVLLGNLLRNACTYTDEGSVTVSVSEQRVTIRDTGIGMSENDQHVAFHAFSRGSQARPGGHGVGLNIVRKLSDRFGWPVTLESIADKGTTAVVEFPDAVNDG